jgi:hypothetical protein
VLKVRSIQEDIPPLQRYYWPPCYRSGGIAADLRSFIRLTTAEQRAELTAKRRNPDLHDAFVNNALGVLYGYVYGYHDSPLYLRTDDELEARLLSAKLELEREFLEHFLRPKPALTGITLQDGCSYLRSFVAENAGVNHALFDFLRDHATAEMFKEFLRLEVLRNEVVDDEVAFMVVGLQGSMKQVATSNLWDECGNGRLDRFHTYWLRQLIESTKDWDDIRIYRKESAPWFSRITSNSFNRLLTRPGYKYQAYGHFLITEGWVFPHFERIVAGLRRVGLGDADIQVYFTAHINIDPHHTEELLAGIENQRPVFESDEIAEVIRGAHAAAAAGVKMFDLIQRYLLAKHGRM